MTNEFHFGNNMTDPEGLSPEEVHTWMNHLIGAASIYISREKWDELREDARAYTIRCREKVSG